MGQWLQWWLKRLLMALAAALATFGALVWLALDFWVAPAWVEKVKPAEPGFEHPAQRPAGCQPDKHACKDMTTCEEARFYLTTCGLKRLDRDQDGVPCETLCR